MRGNPNCVFRNDDFKKLEKANPTHEDRWNHDVSHASRNLVNALTAIRDNEPSIGYLKAARRYLSSAAEELPAERRQNSLRAVLLEMRDMVNEALLPKGKPASKEDIESRTFATASASAQTLITDEPAIRGLQKGAEYRAATKQPVVVYPGNRDQSRPCALA